jgi:hypothetical protein
VLRILSGGLVTYKYFDPAKEFGDSAPEELFLLFFLS